MYKRQVFGERFADNASQYYNTIVEEVLEEMLPYVDALAIQPAFEAEFPKDRFDQIHSVSGKPILICDFAIRFKDGDKDISSWKFEPDSIAAGKAYNQYLRDALATGYVIGSFWCNPVDTSKGFDKPGVKQGFFGDGLSPRPGLHKSVLDLNRHISQTTPNR